ncbi:uncharacterized protein LOC131436729 [Malaya genurostris]|uniref:uncharacterized protein LOC131436729 n=1 Tax=Malaya genurostris TaxID=325434 RepID=UPI0026F3D7CF|nr:uncharacterized protein LOC131436729 [Malaya genurostris]
MEIQNQIYLIIAVFGAVSTLLLIFLVILYIYVINIKKLVVVKEPTRKNENYGFNQDVKTRNITDDSGPIDLEVARKPPIKSNLTKQHNENIGRQNKDVRKEKRLAGGHGRGDRNRQPSESGDTSGRDFDSAFDNEINNMFDIDYYDDQDSVGSARYNQTGRQQTAAPSSGVMMNGGDRNRNLGQGSNNANRQSNNQQHKSRQAGRGGFQSSAHEGRTYFNEMSMRY